MQPTHISRKDDSSKEGNVYEICKTGFCIPVLKILGIYIQDKQSVAVLFFKLIVIQWEHHFSVLSATLMFGSNSY